MYPAIQIMGPLIRSLINSPMLHYRGSRISAYKHINNMFSIACSLSDRHPFLYREENVFVRPLTRGLQMTSKVWLGFAVEYI